jgi:hypothetical protein
MGKATVDSGPVVDAGLVTGMHDSLLITLSLRPRRSGRWGPTDP